MTGNLTRPMRCHTSLLASECGYSGGAGKLRKLPSPPSGMSEVGNACF